ncbi:MAG: hypothetical protein COA62_11770 [Rhodobiaceae bacterium]|nr:MAG: hypothetical protein COA62_11770 [Rhodobiaceae bacterium]
MKNLVDLLTLKKYREIALNQRQKTKLDNFSKIVGMNTEKAIEVLTKRALSRLPNRYSSHYLLPDLEIAQCDRVEDNLIRIKLENGRVFFGQRSEAKEYILWNTLKNYLPDIVISDAYKLALDIQRRYFLTAPSASFGSSGVYIEGGCYTGIKAISWHDSLKEPHRIIAVEIGKSNFEILKMNIEANALSDYIIPVHAGLWRESKQGVQKHAFTTRRFLDETDRWAGHMIKEEPVQLLTLDDLLETYDVDVAQFVNIQVNGAEIEVLKGFTKLDKAKVLRIAAYYSKDGVRNADVIRETLVDRGFKIFSESSAGSITALTPKWAGEFEEVM